jgi:hypothetical protein
MRRNETALAYVCSPDREHHLFHSLTSALRWSSGIERVVVFCVGAKPAHWRFTDARVEVREVPRLFGGYFLGNKAYCCDVDSERLLFLDADTLVLGPLERLWSGWSHDFRARPANAGFGPRWAHEVWTETFRGLGTLPIPMFNSGVLLFQNGAHQRVAELWRLRMQDYLDARLQQPLAIDHHLSEQCALALAVSEARLSIAIMGPSEHTFGWLGEPLSSSVVLHTSAEHDHFDRYCASLGISASRDLLVESE